MVDGVSERYGDLLTGSYDCVDRVVLNAYFSLGHTPGGFRTWWRRWHGGSDDELDNAHLMRVAGRFARRVRAWGAAHGVEVVPTAAGERKHRIAEDYLATHNAGTGVFLVLVARAPATVWDVQRSKTRGHIVNLAKKKSYVYQYSFHIMDPEFGHVTVKMSGHPPFGAQVILNGHELVAAQAAAGIGYTKEGNCFTATADPAGLARIADTLSEASIAGRLGQVCDRWIYTACTSAPTTARARFPRPTWPACASRCPPRSTPGCRTASATGCPSGRALLVRAWSVSWRSSPKRSAASWAMTLARRSGSTGAGGAPSSSPSSQEPASTSSPTERARARESR